MNVGDVTTMEQNYLEGPNGAIAFGNEDLLTSSNMMGAGFNDMYYQGLSMGFNGFNMFPYLASMAYSTPEAYTVEFAQFSELSHESIIESLNTYAHDQQGCKFLQTRLQSEISIGDRILFEKVFAEVINNFDEYSNDKFANYLCQKCAELATAEELKILIDTTLPLTISLCNSPHGTRVIQKLLEVTPLIGLGEMLLSALHGHILALAYDANGSHVVQKLVSQYGPNTCKFVYDELAADAKGLCKDKQGCCVVQRCAEIANPDQRRILADEVADNVLELVSDRFGNYVVQNVLFLDGTEEHRDRIAKQLLPNLEKLCTEKCSSNVIEKLVNANCSIVVEELFRLISSDSTLLRMLSDNYANYVVQTLLRRDPASDRTRKMIEHLESLSDRTGKDEIAAKAIAKLSRAFQGGEQPRRQQGLQGSWKRRPQNQNFKGRAKFPKEYKEKREYKKKKQEDTLENWNMNDMFPMLETQVELQEN